MKLLSTFLRSSMAAGLLLATGFLLTGCEHLYYADPYSTAPASATRVDLTKPTPQPPSQLGTLPPVVTQTELPPLVPVQPVVPPTVTPLPTAPAPGGQTVGVTAGGATIVQVGDLLTVSFSDLPIVQRLEEFKGRVGEDGNITLPYNITIKASGKTPGQLQQEIREAYVPRLYKVLTITVKTEERFFFVGGEVKSAQRYPYIAQMTVLRAIQTAGDFTDFANRKKVQLIRASGQKLLINCIEARKKPELDLQVFPNDTINVDRRWF